MRRIVLLMVAALLASGCALVTRVDVATDLTPGDGDASEPVLSADGRVVAFTSSATNLVDGDTNGVADVFVRDRDAGTTERISVTSDGTESTAPSHSPAISADGAVVAFLSAGDLDGAGTDGTQHAWVHDRTTGTTERVSVDLGYAQLGGVWTVSVDGTGRHVGFTTTAWDTLDPPPERLWRAFVHDRASGVTEEVGASIPAADAELGGHLTVGPIALSLDGSRVALVGGYLTASYVPDPDGVGPSPILIANPGQIWVVDRTTGTETDVPLPATATPSSVRILHHAFGFSGDGRRVTFTSWSVATEPGGVNDPVEVFVHDLDTGEQRTLTDEGRWGLAFPSSISDDGRFAIHVDFVAGTLIGDAPADTDPDFWIWIEDLDTGERWESFGYTLSGDGRTVTSMRLPDAEPGLPPPGAPTEVVVRAARIPEITAAGPAVLAGTTATVQVAGSAFTPGTQVRVAPDDGLVVGSTAFVDGTTLHVEITVAPDAATGPREVRVLTPEAAADRLPDALHIVSESTCIVEFVTIRTAIEAYRAEFGLSYPESLEDLLGNYLWSLPVCEFDYDPQTGALTLLTGT